MTTTKLKQTDKTAWQYSTDYRLDKELGILFLGCSHIDSVHCARGTLKRLLDFALANNYRIVLNGDNNDLMQGRNDPRRFTRGMREEWFDSDSRSSSYINNIINDSVEFLKPYAENIDIFGLGNHETAAIKNLDVDVTSLIAHDLQSYSTSPIFVGGVEGFIKCHFYKTTTKGSRGGNISKNILFMHNGGSCGKRSKGILAYDMLASEYTNADMFITAHTHDMLQHQTKCTVLDKNGKYRYDNKYYLQGPSFEESWAEPGKRSWWTSTNKGARAVGGWLVRMTPKTEDNKPAVKIRCSFED